MNATRTRTLTALLFYASLIIAAGSGSAFAGDCRVTALNVAPPSASADHAAAAPANGQVFTASNHFTGSGPCSQNAAMMVKANWTVSDPSVHLSATQGNHVTATCTAALAKPVTVKATAVSDPKLTGQASLTCR